MRLARTVGGDALTPAELRTIANYIEARMNQGWWAECAGLRCLASHGYVSVAALRTRGVDERTARRVVCRLRETLGLRVGDRPGTWQLSPNV
jgi:hypothetical protein